MNKDNARDYLPLVQALAEGKVIQIRTDLSGWKDFEEFSFEKHAQNYRIKPEPREIWVVLDGDDDGAHMAYLTEDQAIVNKRSGYGIVRYREVIE